MLAYLFLIESSKLLLTRTGIKARTSSISGLWFPWPIYMFFLCFLIDLGTLDSGERSFAFGLPVMFSWGMFFNFHPYWEPQIAHFLAVCVTFISLLSGLCLELSDRQKISGRSFGHNFRLSYMFYLNFFLSWSQFRETLSPKSPPRLSPDFIITASNSSLLSTKGLTAVKADIQSRLSLQTIYKR